MLLSATLGTYAILIYYGAGYMEAIELEFNSRSLQVFYDDIMVVQRGNFNRVVNTFI